MTLGWIGLNPSMHFPSLMGVITHFGKLVCVHFFCSIDESVWDAIKTSWTRPKATKFTWDKAALAAANANSKALNAIFCD